MEKELKYCIPKKIHLKRVSDPPIAVDISHEITKLFNIKNRRQERISEYMCKSIKKTKMKAYAKLAHIDTKLSIAGPTTSSDFRDFFYDSPTTQMSRLMEKSIKKNIHARGLEQTHPQIVDDIMKDAKLEYLDVTHYASTNLKIKDKHSKDGYRIENFKFLGRTENYGKFLVIRKRFEIRWILHYSLLRNILEKCVLGLPYELFQLKFPNVVDVNQLQSIFKEKIRFSAIYLNEFHEKIVTTLESEETYDTRKNPCKYLGACTGLLSVHISRSLAHTIQSIVKFTENANLPPYLKLYVDFEEGLVLKPTLNDIVVNFWKLLDDLIDAAAHMYVLEKGRVKGFETKTIFLCLTQKFIHESKISIRKNIENLYQPIAEYLDKLSSDFAEIYSDINSEGFFNSISDINFEEGCEKIDYYKKFTLTFSFILYFEKIEKRACYTKAYGYIFLGIDHFRYIHKVAYIPDNEYFKIGQLVLVNYRDKLHDSLQVITDSIFDRLCNQHLWEVTDICDTFQLIKTRATQNPLSTEELIEIGKFMSWIRNEHLAELQDRVYESLASLCNIITLGLLTDDHMKTNSQAIKWLEDILPIVELHSANFEQLKFEAEEKLQKVIEDINVMIHDVHPLLVILDEMDDIKRSKKYLADISLHMTKIKEIQVQIERINKEEVCLSFPKSVYAEFEHLKEYVYPFYHLLKLCLDVQRHVAVWEYGQFDLLNFEKTQKAVDKYDQELAEIYKTYRKKLRQAQDDNLPLRFRGTVDDPDLLNWPAPLKLCATTTKILEQFKPSLKLMKIMCNDALCARHWKAMSETAGVNLTPDAGTTLKKIMQIDLKVDIYEYEIISVGATKEKQLLNNLIELEEQWKDVRFTVSKSTDNVWCLTHLEDIESVVDDHIIKVMNMRGSVFVQAHEQRVVAFHKLILDIQNVIFNWVILQEQWIKLLPIFSIENLHDCIPIENAKFEEIDKIFSKHIEYIQHNSVVIEVICSTNILKEVEYCTVAFEEVQKGLRDYFEVVRQNCPRLFFISDRELAEITAQKNFEDQSFVMKIFPGVRHLVFENNSNFSSLASQHGEEINFIERVETKELKTLENVLNRIENQMISTLKIRTGDCYRVFKKTNIRELLRIYPQQILILMCQISWTCQVENALKLQHNIKLLLYKKQLESCLDEKCQIIKKNDVSNLERIQLKNLIINDLNNRYILKNILENGVISENHFDWSVQFRYYYEESICKIKLWRYTLNYGFEYNGNLSPIVLTPNTDRCFRTILNAYFFHYNGLVSGSCETGKSKTIRSLADALGILFLAFKCTEYTNSHTLIQLLKGNILCGSWLCLEDFHMLKHEIFSILSQEMLSILEAKAEKYKKVMLNDCYININPKAFVCVTTDVVQTNNLSENLKVLFRRYNLYCPDIRVIAEAYLRSQGFDNSRILSKKIACTFETLPQMLWFQKQYSFSIRVLVNILQKCENNKIKNPDENEFEVVFKSIYDIYYDSVLEEDKSNLKEVLKNVFQKELPLSIDEKLQDVINNICEKLTILPNNVLIQKVIQTYHCLKRNNGGVVIIGDSFCGKFSIINICQQLFFELENIDVECNVVNPKCVTHRDLFGKISTEKNMEWTDGILLKILRQSFTNNTRKWLIFDGQMDSSWTCSLNNIFDNARLFLESGEQLLVNKSFSFVFEATDLRHTDPTLVSHSHVIFVPNETLNWKSITTSWTKHCNSEWLKEHLEQLMLLINWLIPPCLNFFETCSSNKVCNLNPNTIVANLLKTFRCIFDDAVSKTNKRDEDPKNIPSWVHACLIQASVWSIGGLLDFAGRQKFDEFFKRLLRGQDCDFPYPNGFEKLEVGLPQESLLFDYSYLYKQRGTWKLWSDLLKNEKIVESLYMSEFLVPSIDTLRCNYFLNLSIRNKYNFLIVGPGGVGKSIILKDCYVNRSSEIKFDKALIHFSNHTSSLKLQSLILSKLNKRKSGYYTPSKDKSLLCYMDDMHMSERDGYNISSAMELLRMHCDYKSWYSLKSYEKVHLDQCQFIGAMEFKNNTTISKRLLRHFNVFVINHLPCEVVSKIYSQGLLYMWKKSGFPSDILTASTQIANATLKIYNQLLKDYKPSPTKCHYIFNLKSFSKVIKGCSMLKKETYDANKKIHLKLWIHEMLRVFGDRLEVHDLKQLYENLRDSISEQFSENFEEIFNIQEGQDVDPLPKLFFGAFNEKMHGVNHKYYEEIHFQQLSELCVSALSRYNETHRYKLDLIFFDYALEKLARIGRVISIPCENALLLGSTGCGRQTLVKLASFIYKHEFFQPEITKSYDKTRWDSDFKETLIKCGAMNKSLVLLISEEELIDDSFLDNIDYLLRDGELTDLYTMEEKQKILELSRLAAQGGNRNLDISSHCVFLYFNKRCKENLHLFLSLNRGEKLRQRMLKYPSLGLTNNVMLWKDWPDFALKSVANAIIRDVDIDQGVKEKTVTAAIHFHRNAQRISELRDLVTPKHFLHLTKLFLDLIVGKQSKIMAKKMRFLLGLQKLSDAESQILKMQKALAEYQPQLEAMTKNAVEMTEQIALETIEVEKASALVRKDEKIAGEQALIAQTLKSECEAELAQAIPILEDAISALNTLKPTDITLVKSMKNPPDAIKLVMASVCVIKDVRPDRIPDPSTGRKTIDYWGPSKRILGDMNFLQTLKDFDKDHIKPEIMVKIRKEYLPHKDFKPHIVAKASSAAEGLCKWIIAMDMYDKVAKEVAPKKEKLNKAEREYAGTMAILNQKKEEVVRIEEKLAALNVLLDEAVKKQQKLQKEVDLCNQKLYSAQKLIGSLSGEKNRWTEAAGNLQGHFNVLSGDLILSSAVIAYLAPLSNRIRSNTVENWFNFVKSMNIPCTDPFDISQVLSNDVEIDLWNENGLPQDKMFLENAIIFKHSKYFCLFIDPQSQANAWIQKTEGHINLYVTKFNHSDWLTKLRNSIIIGKSILIKDMNNVIPPCITHLTYRQTFMKNNATFVRVNGENLKVHKNFRLYITSNQSEPKFSLELRSRVNVINFSLTKKAMQENFITMTVEIEQPEIKRLTLLFIKRNKENKSELKNLENKILNTLCESKADILEDQDAIQILDKSKELTKIVKEKQKDMEGFELNIVKFKEGYIDVSHQVADLFFCVEKLSRLNPVYQFSLEWFTNTYFSSILNSGKSKNLQIRCEYLQAKLVRDLFTKINRALFEKDKNIFNFWLAVNIAISKKQVSFEKLLMFIGTEEVAGDTEFYEKIKKPVWIENETWLGMQTLTRFKNVKFLIEKFIDDEKFWRTSLKNWDQMTFDNISHFDKLMLTKILKPQYIFAEIDKFTKLILGADLFSFINFNMQEVYNESYNLSPVLFISTPGENVLKILHSFANVKKFMHKFRYISLGEKQTVNADKLINEGQKEGHWVLIENCHLSLKWLDQLDQKLGNMDFDNTHENFRLFLTTGPHAEFPLGLLQNCIKVVPEQPDTLKKALTKNFTKIPLISDDFYSGCPGKQETFIRLCYRLCYAHFVLHRRQNISNWNIQYDFDEPDLLISLQHLQNFVNEKYPCLINKIIFFIGECNYGGLIQNDRDKKFVREIFIDFLDGHITEKGSFVFSNSKAFGFPIKSDRHDYLGHISKLPDSDNAEMFFLTEVEYLSSGVQNTDIFLSETRKLAKETMKDNIIIDEFKILARIDDILEGLPRVITQTDEGTSKIIHKEIGSYNTLIQEIENTVKRLRNTLDGTCQLTSDLEHMGRQILENQLPIMWQRFMYPTVLNLSSFLKDLREKVTFFENFSKDKRYFWLGAFYFPKALLCSTKLSFAAKNNISMEEVEFEYEFLNDICMKSIPESGIIIEKLYLKSAKLDHARRCLVDLPEKLLFDQLPPMLFKPIKSNKKGHKQSGHEVICPVFKIESWRRTEFRHGMTNFITSINIKSDKNESYWTKRGINIACEVDSR